MRFQAISRQPRCHSSDHRNMISPLVDNKRWLCACGKSSFRSDEWLGLAFHQHAEQIAVEPRNRTERYLLRTGGGSLSVIIAATESFGIMLGDHVQGATLLLGLALEQ